MGCICDSLLGVLPLVGFATGLYVVLSFLYGLKNFYVTYYTPTTLDFKSFGKWALVTGSTDGIGKGIAHELAKRKLNIILVSRNPEKLKNVATEIEKKFDVDTKCVTFDFSVSDNLQKGGDTSIYDVISDAIKGLEVGILVNNVGLGATGEFLNAFSKSENMDMSTGLPKLVYCNDLSMAQVTSILLPEMLKRKKGLIINVSSIAGCVVFPKTAIYSSSKRFANSFTKSLDAEYKNKGIIIQNIQPGPVRTNMTSGQNKTANWFYPEYETYAKHTMNTVGKMHATAGYHYHGMVRALLNALPEFMSAKLFMIRSKKN